MRKYIVSILCAFICFVYSTMPSIAQSAGEISFWETARDSGNSQMLQLYLDKYPNGTFVDLVRLMLEQEANTNEVHKAAALKNPTEQCDRLATHSNEHDPNVEPVMMRELKTHAEEAIRACSAAVSKRGNARDHYQLYRSLYAAGLYDKAVNQLEKAAALGHRNAQYWHAQNYVIGESGIKQDKAKGLALHKRYADAGNGLSAGAAGYLLFEEGRYKEAPPYLLAGEKAGNMDVHYPLCILYSNGSGGELSDRKAHDHCMAAIEKNSYRSSDAFAFIVDETMKPFEVPLNDWTDYNLDDLRILKETIEKLGDHRASDSDYAHYCNLILISLQRLNFYSLVERDDNKLGVVKSLRDQIVDKLKDALKGHLYRKYKPDEALSQQEADKKMQAFPNFMAEMMGKLKPYILTFAKRKKIRTEIGKIDPSMSRVAIASKHCVSAASGHDSGMFKITFSNTCAFPINLHAVAGYKTRQAIQNRMDEWIELPANKSKTVGFKENPAARSEDAYSQYQACFQVDGMPIPGSRGYPCEPTGSYRQKQIEDSVAIDEIFKQLTDWSLSDS
nr:hypothetical protein [uncultured Cohaesibacter sp.]